MEFNLLAFFRVKRYDRNKMTQIRHLAIHSIAKPPEQRIGFSLYFLILVAQMSIKIDKCSICNELITQ